MIAPQVYLAVSQSGMMQALIMCLADCEANEDSNTNGWVDAPSLVEPWGAFSWRTLYAVCRHGLAEQYGNFAWIRLTPAGRLWVEQTQPQT